MKELSVEKKAARYDEAIKKVNDYYEGKTKLYSDVDKTLDYLFPELKENEDEKIRKYLIKYFEASKDELSEGFRWNGITIEECISWLEKQGQVKESLISQQVNKEDDMIEIFSELKNKDERIKAEIIRIVDIWTNSCPVVNGIPAGTLIAWLENQGERSIEEIEDPSVRKYMKLNKFSLANMLAERDRNVEETIKSFENQDEQKISFSLPTEGKFPYNNPADTLDEEIENIWEKLSCDNKFTATKDGFHEVVVHFVNWYEKQDEQKPAWSEEDLISLGYLATFVDENGDSFYGKNKPNVVKWIRSFANFHPTQKQEWSEEDEKMYAAIIFTLAGFMGNEDKIDWLHSLKDRYTWRPSEVQMQILNKYAEQNNYDGSVLTSLYRDLKKLKG